MKLLPSNKGSKNLNLFGLLANRFLYKDPAPEGHVIPDDDVMAAQREARERYDQGLQELQKMVDGYNKNYGDDVENKQADAYYESIKLDDKNLAATKEQIEKILKALKDKKGDTWRATLPNDPQYNALNNYLVYIEDLQKLPTVGAETVEGAHRSRLQRRHELMTAAKDRQELWGKKPAYKELSSVFDNLAASDSFKGLWQTPDGLSTQKQRETKQLFFAIMAEKTNNFEDTFVLGASFKNDPEENIRNFPYIYNEFLKHEGTALIDAVSMDKLAAAESQVNLAHDNLNGIDDAPTIIANNAGAGINPAELGPMPVMPDSDNWQKRKSTLINMAFRLEEKAKQDKDLPQPPAWEKAAKDLRVHAAYADACLSLSRLKDREKLVKAKFTRNELSKPTRRRLVMELAMRQLAKATEMVDRGPFGNSDWQTALHPTVRRMLIASIYDNGVASYKKDLTGKVEYKENTNNENIWMMAALATSNYFNFKEVGDNMDPDHLALLKAAYLGSRISVLVEDAQPTEDVLNAWIEVRKGVQGEVDTDAEKKLVEEKMSQFPPELRARFAKYKLNELEDTYKAVVENRKRLREFLDRARTAIQKPYDPESQKFIKEMREGLYKGEVGKAIDDLGTIAIVDGASLEAYERQMANLEINFKTAELQDKNMLMFFEGLGINIEGVYPAYLAAIRKDPHLKAEYWDAMLLGEDAEFDKLIVLFQQIIPNSITRGKEDFIAGLQALRKKYRGQKSLTDILSHQQEGSEDAVALNVYRMLKIHLSGRAESYAQSDQQQKDIEARMKGLHVGDKITKYVEGVWDMLAGPGQSMANRAAGLVLMYGFYKSARMAMKGEGKAGKALRALFVAGAVEIAAKEITGRGVLDRLGLDAIAGAMEGTYEAVLLQDAEKRMDDKNITTEAHAAALMELNDVPFHQLMAWYESSDPNGMPRQKGTPDLFPNQINLNLIGPKVTWEVKDKKLEARRVVYQAVKHFFAYVGDKDNHRDDAHGKEALKERWVTMVDDPNYKAKYSTYDHREWLQAGGVKKSDITWQMVMRSEIDPREVDLTKGRTPLGRLETAAREALTDVTDWAREYVYNPGAGHAEIFFQNLGEGAQDAQAFFAEFAKTTERKIYFAKESAILWYKDHQYEIKRVAENHYQLLVTAVKMPFKLVYAVDNWAIPWTLAKLQQVEETLRPDKAHTIDQEIHAGHIVSNPDSINVPNEQLNPEFSYYGLYQAPFLDALTDSADRSKNKPDKNNWYYEDPSNHVGYFISQVTEKEAGVTASDTPENANRKMSIKSREKAEVRFRREGLSNQEIKDYLDKIHTISKTTDPKTMYVFWRMPLKESMELHLKNIGRWADYMDSNKHREREPFTVDPSQTSWENLQRAFMLDMDPVRKVLRGAGGYVAQVPRFMLWNLKMGGNLVKGIGHLFYAGRDQAGKDAFDAAVNVISERPDAQKVFIDELFTSAANPHKAVSAFYSDPVNSKLYDFSLQFASSKTVQQPLFLGLMKTKDNYEGTLYLDPPPKGEAATYAKMREYYTKEWMPTHGKKADPDIEAALTAAEAGQWGAAGPANPAPGPGQRPAQPRPRR